MGAATSNWLCEEKYSLSTFFAVLYQPRNGEVQEQDLHLTEMVSSHLSSALTAVQKASMA